jgi:predicted small integral membrane protein
MRKALLFLLLCFASIQSWAALNGTYTINALAPASATNYQSITAAIGDMNIGFRLDGGPINGPGVSGPVVLRIAAASGPYNEQITFPAITGASATNTIRLTGGPTRETVTFNATVTGDRQVIKLLGSRHIILDSLTLINTGITFGYGVHITNSADSNIVRNCVVHVDSASTSANFAGITISGATVTTNGDWGDNNLIENNVVNGGYYSITARGTSASVFNQRNKFVNNFARSFYYYGLSMAYQQNAEMYGNRVMARATGTTAGFGCYMLNCDQMQVYRNHMIRYGSYGIYGSVLTGSTTRSKIYNNMIGGLNLSATSPYGIYLLGAGTNTDIWHNTVMMNGATTSRGIFISAGTGFDVRNNNFSVMGSTGGYPLFVTTAGSVTAVDYNNYYAPGSSVFLSIGGVAYTTATYVGGGGFNANSRNGDPALVSTTNLHVSTGVQLWDGGTNVGITTDFDGETRPLAPTALYDIGADEHTPAGDDAGITALNSPTPPFAAGLLPVTVTLKNFGLATLSSAQIGWRVNGVLQTPYSWSGSIAPSASVAGINIGSYTFAAGTSYTFKIWSYNPNGTTDASFINDTLTISGCTSMSGNYRIGGVGADFATVNQAIDALECGGVSGPVTLRLTAGAGPFNEQVMINPIPGASAINNIRLTGGPGREILQTASTTTTDRYVIALNGADHITLDSLRILNTNLTFAYTVQFENDADSNKLTNSILVVDSAATSSNITNISFSGDAPGTLVESGDGNLLQNNMVYGGYYGINMRGLSTTSFESNNSLIGNTLRGAYFYSIYIANQNICTVRQNDIQTRNTGTTSAYGIYMSYVDNFQVERNYVRVFGTYGIYGTSANYQGGIGTSRASIANNMIGGVSQSTTPYGIYLTTNARNIDIFHNTVSQTGVGRCLYILSGSGNSVRNNIFNIAGSSATGWAAYVSSTTYISSMDYNLYNSGTSSNFIYVGTAYTPATYVGGGGYNLNSRNGDPEFVDAALDLHTFAVLPNDVGDNAVGITTDIDGEARPIGASTIVDMGADEFTPLQYNAEPLELVNPGNGDCPDSLVPVLVSLRNMGTTPMTNIVVTVEITGASPAILSDTLNDPLPFGVIDTLAVGFWNSYPGGTSTFRVYTTHPLEQYAKNDSFSVDVVVNIEPPAPTGTGATGCSPSDLDLTATVDGFTHRWYDAPTAGTMLLQGDTLSTGPLTTTTTYWLEALGYGAGSLTTTFADDNGCMGNMFDVTPVSSIRIDSMDLNIGVTTAEQVYIYYRVGSYVGFETTPGAWIPFDTISVPTPGGTAAPTRITLPTPLNLPAGATYGMYVHLNGNNIDYTNGTGTYSNADLSIVTGTGVCTTPFAAPIAGRIWNGTLHYTKETCPSERVPVVATIIPTPVVDLGPDTSTCGPIVLDAGNPGDTYLWSTALSTQTVNVVSSGTYDVTVNHLGCIASDTVNITVNSLPAASLGPDESFCPGASATIGTTFSPTASYLWNTSATTNTITVSTPGTYYIDVVDIVSGCTNTDTIVVTLSPEPLSDLGADQNICDGSSVTLGPLFSPTASYTWSTSATTPTIVVTTSGSYSVLVTDGVTGCSSSDTVNVNVILLPSGAFTFDTTLCPVVNFNSTTTGTGPFSYSWNFGDGGTSFSEDPSHDYTAAGDGTYSVILIVGNACANDTVMIDVVVDCLNGTQDALSQGISLWPNPSNGVFHLSSDLGEAVAYEVMSLHGQVILTGTLAPHATTDLSLQNAATGVYTVVLHRGDQIETIKLVVQ